MEPRLSANTAARTARNARRGSPCRWCRWRSRPATGAMLTGARRSRWWAEANAGSQPAAASAVSLASARPTPAGRHLQPHDAGPRTGPRPRHADPQVAAVEVVAHREQPGAFAGVQVGHLPPSLGGQHRAVMSLDVADHRQRARTADVVQRTVDHRQPVLLRQPLGDAGLGVAHAPPQALAAGVRLGAGNVESASQLQPHGCGGSSTRCPAEKIAALPIVIRSKRRSRVPSASTAPAPQLPARPVTVPCTSVRVRRASTRIVPSTNASRRGRTAAAGTCRRNSPPSSTSSHAIASGESTCT